jgi:hypothetical protein
MSLNPTSRTFSAASARGSAEAWVCAPGAGAVVLEHAARATTMPAQIAHFVIVITFSSSAAASRL